MKMDLKRMATAAAAVMIAGIFSWTLAQARKDHSHKKQPPKVVPIQSEISVQNDQTVITMTPQAQTLAGIATAPLRKASARRQITAPAEVLSVEGLAKLRKSYIVAKAQLAKARAKAEVSRTEYARLKSLYQDNQNVSQKSLQSAEGALRADEADVQAAQQELALEGPMARQNWGSVVEQWVEEGTPLLERVLNQQELLVEVTVPPGKSFARASLAQLEMPGGHYREGSFVSLFPKVDPRMQGVGLLYRISAQAGLAPGTNLVAHYSAGPRVAGVVVPSSAVVWWQGKAWAYAVPAPGRFTRRAVPTDTPAHGGWLVTRGFAPGDLVVTRGAEQLLAIESSPGPSSPAGE